MQSDTSAGNKISVLTDLSVNTDDFDCVASGLLATLPRNAHLQIVQPFDHQTAPLDRAQVNPPKP